MNDIASALTQSLSKDGQTTPTGNLPMGSNRHTGVGNAAARSDYAAAGQVQDSAFLWCGTAGGTANALTLSPSPAITAYAAGQVFRFISSSNANTAATTVAISGLATQAIQNGGVALVGGEIAASTLYEIVYDGTAFQLRQMLVLPVSDAVPIVKGSSDATKKVRIEADGITTATTRVWTAQDRNVSVADIADAPMQGRLTYQSTTQIRLVPWNGNRLIINNTCQVIPSGGVNLANTGLTAGTLYYIYAYMSSGTMTLEASATGHVADTTTGIEIKSGDATRTLVGLVYMDSGTPGTFSDAATKKWVRSWNNRLTLFGINYFTTLRQVTSSTFSEINSEIRVQFVCWSDDAVKVGAAGMLSVSGSIFAYTSVAFNGTTAELCTSQIQPGANNGVPLILTYTKTGLTEGLNYATLVSRNSDNATAVNYVGNGAANTGSCALMITI